MRSSLSSERTEISKHMTSRERPAGTGRGLQRGRCPRLGKRWAFILARTPHQRGRRACVYGVSPLPISSRGSPFRAGGKPWGWPVWTSRFSPAMAVVVGVAPTPRVPIFIRLKNSRRAARTQKDPTSRTQGTKRLESSPWWLVIP